jgi:hypothetical protein
VAAGFDVVAGLDEGGHQIIEAGRHAEPNPREGIPAWPKMACPPGEDRVWNGG